MSDDLTELCAARDHFRTLWLRAAEERDAMSDKLTEQAEMLERERDAADAAWAVAEAWQEYCDAAEAALAEERQEREALIRFEIDRLTGREPKRRGRPPSWSPDAEAEVERLHRAGASVRAIAADLGVSKTQVHRVIARVRQRQAEAAEHARVAAIASGRSPVQAEARSTKRRTESRPIEDYDPARADRYRAYLASL